MSAASSLVSAPIAPYFITVLVAGDAAVGKTALARRFASGEFDAGFVAPDAQPLHAGAELDGKVVRVEVREVPATSATAAPEAADVPARAGEVVVYDVGSRASFEGVRRRVGGSSARLPCVIVGTKADAAGDRQVSSQRCVVYGVRALDTTTIRTHPHARLPAS